MLLGARQFFEKRGAPAWTNPYVTDGLIAMWDGEWNAGGGVHDAAATVWKDLIGTNDFHDFDSGVTWGDKYFHLPDVRNAARAYTLYDESSVKTVECVIKPFGNNGLVVAAFSVNPIRGEWSRWVGLRANNTINFGSALPYASASVTSSEFTSYSGTFDESWKIFRNATQLEIGVGQGMNWGTSWVVQYPTLNAAASALSVTDIANIRLYSRPITAAEIAANYAIDKARFNLP